MIVLLMRNKKINKDVKYLDDHDSYSYVLLINTICKIKERMSFA